MKYDKIILDFDGVICDSNGFKSENILNAAKKYVPIDTATSFREYFIRNNGIPREIKVNKYFEDLTVAENILKEYDYLNSNLVNAPLVAGVDAFLQLNKGNEIIILSGGVKKEINQYLRNKNMQDYFSQILSGPLTKEENFSSLNLEGLDVLYVGDALHDYEISIQFSLDFIFMYGYTQFYEWNTYNFSENVVKVKDFNQLIQSTYGKN